MLVPEFVIYYKNDIPAVAHESINHDYVEICKKYSYES